MNMIMEYCLLIRESIDVFSNYTQFGNDIKQNCICNIYTLGSEVIYSRQ